MFRLMAPKWVFSRNWPPSHTPSCPGKSVQGSRRDVWWRAANGCAVYYSKAIGIRNRAAEWLTVTFRSGSKKFFVLISPLVVRALRKLHFLNFKILFAFHVNFKTHNLYKLFSFLSIEDYDIISVNTI